MPSLALECAPAAMPARGASLRILHVLDHSIPMHSGYSFRTLGILEQQRRRGWRPFLLTGPKHVAARADEEEVDGWHFYRTRLEGRPGVWAILRALSRRLSEVAARTSPDLIHAHSPVLNALPALKVGARLGIPVVYEVRAFWEDAAVSHGTSMPGGPRYHLTRALEGWALRRADAVTTICEGLRDAIVARGIDAAKVTVIPNAVDEAAFAEGAPPDPALARRLNLDGALVLGFLGSFYRYEGLHLLLDALPMVLARRPEVRVLLVGGGPEEEALKEQAQRLGLAGQVVFAGRVPHAEVPRYYALVDALVLPRLSMRLTELVTPLKPLEAMAGDKLVLASAVGGHRELMRDGETGYLFPPGDAAALARRVLEALDGKDDWPRLRRQARRFVEAERTWGASVARYEGVYARVLSDV